MTRSSPITAHLTPRPRHHEPRHAQVVAGAHDGAEVAGVAHAAEDDPDRARGGGGGGVRGERLVPQRRHVRHDALVHVVLLVPVIIIIININTSCRRRRDFVKSSQFSEKARSIQTGINITVEG